jgi:hypothetical protein
MNEGINLREIETMEVAGVILLGDSYGYKNQSVTLSLLTTTKTGGKMDVT